MSYHTNVFPEVFHTEKGTPFLKACGVALIGYTRADLGPIDQFIDGFDVGAELDNTYSHDGSGIAGQTPDSELLIKAAGQLCYLSLGDKRTRNSDIGKYLDNIKEQAHGSVLEHANFTFLLYGIDRAVTHELVRHRAGFAFSQVSQRYVSGKTLRFVERPEFQKSEALHAEFVTDIDRAVASYDFRARKLMEAMGAKLETMSRTDARKAVNQAARACLPNETEAPIIVTANARAWRHAIDMRASKFADTTIRALFVEIAKGLKAAAPHIFSDHEIIDLPDGTQAVEAKWRKV